MSLAAPVGKKVHYSPTPWGDGMVKLNRYYLFGDIVEGVRVNPTTGKLEPVAFLRPRRKLLRERNKYSPYYRGDQDE